MNDSKAIITEVIKKPVTEYENVKKVKPVIIFAKKEKKKYDCEVGLGVKNSA